MFKFLCKAAGMVAVTALIPETGRGRFQPRLRQTAQHQDHWQAERGGQHWISSAGADGPTAIFISGRANPQAVSNVFSRLAGVVKARWNRLWA